MDDSLIARRSKRSTAGNRMEAALAEFKVEELGMDVEDDADFAMDRDEEDLFESDFESTDEEGAQEDVDAAAEKLIRQEESRVRKTGRSHLERITALAHARQAATFNPTSIAPSASGRPKGEKKLKRHVSLGIAINAETGEVLEGGALTENTNGDATVGPGKRHSTRTHTVLNTNASVTRSRDEVRKQSSTPKRVKVKTKAPTQSELIARALDMEEGNIAEHKNYLTLEEEKRRKARAIRSSVQGPLIRWLSKREVVTVMVQPPPPPQPHPLPPPPPPVSNPYVQYPPTADMTYPAKTSAYAYAPAHYLPVSPYQSSTSATQPSSPFQQWPPPPPPPAYLQTPLRQSLATTSPQILELRPVPTLPPVAALVPPPQPSLRPIEKKEIVGKQYVVHELGQTEKIPRPAWKSTMTAMFGDHADWENLRVYTTKGRPYARPTRTCLVTGKAAKYLDPRTSVPYADLGAYRVLSQVLRHEHMWSPTLQCYVSKEGCVFAQGGTQPVY